MLQRKLLSLILSSSMLIGAVPVIYAQDEETDTVTVNDAGTEVSDITFTEYNDKDGGMYEVCGVNRLEPRTDSAIPYQDEAAALASARDYAKETSERVKFLSGEDSDSVWDISVVKNLEMGAERGLINADGTENPFAAVDFKEDDTWKKDVPVPSSWTSYGEWWNNVNTPDGEDTTWVWDFPIYDNVKMPWQAGEQPYSSSDSKTDMYGTLTPGEAPVRYNPIGFYRTTFTTDGLTRNEGDRVVISFQGVESAYYVFVNGQAVGHNEDTFRGHEYDITDYLVDGENTLAVRVHKFCDATWLEDQDMIYDGGIFRDVYLISLPAVSIEDYKIETDLDENYENAELIVKGLEVKNNTADDVPAGYTVSAKLYDIDDFSNPVTTLTFTSDKEIPAGGSIVFDEKRVTVNSPKQWSAEKPELYALSLNLSDEDSNALESSALLVGFREIEYTMTEVDAANKNITDSYSRITINGQPLLMKGTNRHDTDPLAGKYVSKELYDIDLKTMKQYNINTIRTSHYANDEYLYYLADTQGFYLMAETNAECHAIANKDRNTAEVYQTILRPMFMDRTKTAYETLKNHSSINEKNDTWAYKAGHEVAHEQFTLTDEVINALSGAAKTEADAVDVNGNGISVTEDSEKFTVKGNDFSFNVSKKTGFLSDYVYKNETLIQQLRPNYTRDNHNNDSPMIDNWRYANEEKNIEAIPNTIGYSVDESGRYVIDVGMKLTVDYSGPEYAEAFLRYVVDQSGAVTYRMYLDTTDMPRQTKDGRFILRLGSEMKLDGGYENITWYGNGIKTGTDGEYGYKYPVPESYRERDTFAVKGIYSSTATDMFFPHLDTQETGTVNNVTWAVMDSESSDTALLVTADETYKGRETDPNYTDNTLEVSALHYSTKDLRNATKHPYELTSSSSYTQESNVTYFNVDHKSLGIGNASCGP